MIQPLSPINYVKDLHRHEKSEGILEIIIYSKPFLIQNHAKVRAERERWKHTVLKEASLPIAPTDNFPCHQEVSHDVQQAEILYSGSRNSSNK